MSRTGTHHTHTHTHTPSRSSCPEAGKLPSKGAHQPTGHWLSLRPTGADVLDSMRRQTTDTSLVLRNIRRLRPFAFPSFVETGNVPKRNHKEARIETTTTTGPPRGPPFPAHRFHGILDADVTWGSTKTIILPKENEEMDTQT